MGALENLFDAWDKSARNSLDRWRDSAKKIDAKTYTQDDYFSDVMYGWLQWALVFYGGYISDALTPGVAILDIVVGVDTSQDDTKVVNPPQGNPQATKLTLRRAGNNAPQNTPQEIPAGNVSVQFAPNSPDTLVVQMKGLNALGLHVGNIYEGSVEVGVAEIAKTVARVKA